MYREISRLLLYGDLGMNSILSRLSAVIREWEEGGWEKIELIGKIYEQVKRILDLGTVCGFDENLWHCYLTWILMTNDNSFTRTCERVGANEGSVNKFARSDFAIFRKLFDYDFTAIEQDLGIDCFSTLCHYQAVPKRLRMYNQDVSYQVRTLSHALAAADVGHLQFRNHFRLHDHLTQYMLETPCNQSAFLA